MDLTESIKEDARRCKESHGVPEGCELTKHIQIRVNESPSTVEYTWIGNEDTTIPNTLSSRTDVETSRVRQVGEDTTTVPKISLSNTVEGELSTEVEECVDEFEDTFMCAGAHEIEDLQIRVNLESGAVVNGVISVANTQPELFNELSESVTSEGSRIEDPDVISRIEFNGHVQVAPSVMDPQTITDPLSHDYTVYYETDTPHSGWANCESLQEYAEMVADNSDDETVEDVLQRDTYYNHTHLTGGQKKEPDAVVISAGQQTLTDAVELTSSDAGKLFLTRLVAELDQVVITGAAVMEI